MSNLDAFKKKNKGQSKSILDSSVNSNSVYEVNTENKHIVKVIIKKEKTLKLKEIRHPKDEQISLKSICLLIQEQKWAPQQTDRVLIYGETKGKPKTTINLKNSEDFKVFEHEKSNYNLVLEINNQNSEAKTLEEVINHVQSSQAQQQQQSFDQSEEQGDQKSQHSNVEEQILENLQSRAVMTTIEPQKTQIFHPNVDAFPSTVVEDDSSKEFAKLSELKEKAAAILYEKMKASQQQIMKLFETSKVKLEIKTFPVKCSSCHESQVKDFIYACRQHLKIVLCTDCAPYKNQMLQNCEFVSFSSLQSYNTAVQNQEKNQEEIAKFIERMRQNAETKSRKIREEIDSIKPDFS